MSEINDDLQDLLPEQQELGDIEDKSIPGIMDDLLTEQEIADLFRKSLRTLQRWRSLGTGPPWIEIGDSKYYRVRTARKWVLSKERTPVRAA